jgi:hypothetical protein
MILNITISTPAAGAVLGGSFTVSGTASCDEELNPLEEPREWSRPANRKARVLYRRCAVESTFYR